MTLSIAPGFALPVDAVTETFAILAVKRAGKSNAAVVMAEEMYDAGVPWVAIDPKGDWWGVRAAGDGKAPGLSVLVFGGLHGDVPLEPTAGRLVADLVVDQRITCVLDVSEFTKADQRRFLTDFADRLYKRNREPLHVFCEEADEYIPQQVRGEAAKLVGAFEQLVKRGGFRGIGITLVTQRSASLNKDVLTQAGTLIALRTPSPQDRKAILSWVDYHDTGREVVDQLPTLENGEAWVFSPQWLGVVQKIRFRRRRTFDSGATPKVGGKPTPPARLADVDLAAITAAMADTIERAKADDPKALRARVAELEKELTAERAKPLPEPVEIRVEVPVLTPEIVDQLEAALAPAAALLGEAQETLLKHRMWTEEQLHARQDLPRARPASDRPAQVERPRTAERPDPQARRDAGRPAVPRTEGAPLGRAERRILSVLAQHGRRTTQQVALLTAYSGKSGGFRNALSSLRTAGYIDGRGAVDITDAGRTALGDYDPLPTGQALVDWWCGQLGKAERSILLVAVDAYPATLPTAEVAERTDYSATSGGFRNALSRLRTLELISGRGEIRAADELAGGAR